MRRTTRQQRTEATKAPAPRQADSARPPSIARDRAVETTRLQLQSVLGNRVARRLFDTSGLAAMGSDSRHTTNRVDPLRAAMEAMSGVALADVEVVHNSNEPAALNAAAFTQGTVIHIGPGEEANLPHEMWHAVQQKQGRVRSTLTAGGAGFNDDALLEHEADIMGARAVNPDQGRFLPPMAPGAAHPAVQVRPAQPPVIQRKLSARAKAIINSYENANNDSKEEKKTGDVKWERLRDHLKTKFQASVQGLTAAKELFDDKEVEHEYQNLVKACTGNAVLRTVAHQQLIDALHRGDEFDRLRTKITKSDGGRYELHTTEARQAIAPYVAGRFEDHTGEGWAEKNGFSFNIGNQALRMNLGQEYFVGFGGRPSVDKPVDYKGLIREMKSCGGNALEYFPIDFASFDSLFSKMTNIPPDIVRLILEYSSDLTYRASLDSQLAAALMAYMNIDAQIPSPTKIHEHMGVFASIVDLAEVARSASARHAVMVCLEAVRKGIQVRKGIKIGDLHTITLNDVFCSDRESYFPGAAKNHGAQALKHPERNTDDWDRFFQLEHKVSKKEATTDIIVERFNARAMSREVALMSEEETAAIAERLQKERTATLERRLPTLEQDCAVLEKKVKCVADSQDRDEDTDEELEAEGNELIKLGCECSHAERDVAEIDWLLGLMGSNNNGYEERLDRLNRTVMELDLLIKELSQENTRRSRKRRRT